MDKATGAGLVARRCTIHTTTSLVIGSESRYLDVLAEDRLSNSAIVRVVGGKGREENENLPFFVEDTCTATLTRTRAFDLDDPTLFSTGCLFVTSQRDNVVVHVHGA